MNQISLLLLYFQIEIIYLFVCHILKIQVILNSNFVMKIAIIIIWFFLALQPVHAFASPSLSLSLSSLFSSQLCFQKAFVQFKSLLFLPLSLYSRMQHTERKYIKVENLIFDGEEIRLHEVLLLLNFVRCCCCCFFFLWFSAAAKRKSASQMKVTRMGREKAEGGKRINKTFSILFSYDQKQHMVLIDFHLIYIIHALCYYIYIYVYGAYELWIAIYKC